MNESNENPTRIGGFRVLDAAPGGGGAEGVVWRAVCEEPPFPGVSVGEVVALKTMAVSDGTGAQFRKLQRRTKVLSGIDHPNVVRYRGCFQLTDVIAERQFVVMDWLEGETLRDRLKRQRSGLDADEALSICEQAVAGLEAAEKAGVVHRDIKPGNIFLCRDGSVKLIDFELGYTQGGTLSDASGHFLGTFNYMAPEFIDSKFHGDNRSDVFSMGVVAHEALTGRLPYAVRGHANQPDFDFLERWSDPGRRTAALSVSERAFKLLPGLEDVLGRMLSPDAAGRIRGFADVRKALSGVRYREFQNGSVRYRLIRIVGKGGFGEVYKARMLPEGRIVAVKHLHDRRSGDRFRKEARLMQQLRDEYFTQFIDYFETNESGVPNAYLVMDFLPDMPGSSLRDAIRRASGKGSVLDPNDVFAAFGRYLKGLAVLHGRQVYHRDIKPSNLYYPNGRPNDAVIMDMGIARNAAESITHGQIPGTLDYMPPEVVMPPRTADGQEFRGDARMDLFALGLCLYEALTGKMGYPRLPPDDAGLREFYMRSKAMRPPDFSDPEIVRRPALKAILDGMSNPNYAKRFSDAAQVARMLGGIDWQGAVSETPPVTPDVPEPPTDTVQSVRSAERAPQTSDVPAPMPEPRPRPKPARPRRPLPVKTLAAAVLVPALLGLSFLLLKEPVGKWWSARELSQTEQIERRANTHGAEVAVEAVTSAYGRGREAGDAAAADWERKWAGLKYPDDGVCLRNCRRKISQAKASTLAVLAKAEAAHLVEAYRTALSPEVTDASAADWKRMWSESLKPLDERRYQDVWDEIEAARTLCLDRAVGRRTAAGREADAVLGGYKKARNVAEGDARARAWVSKWTTNGIPAEVVGAFTNQFDVSRRECIARLQKDEAEKRDRDERERKVRQLVIAARKESAPVVAAFADDTQLASAASSLYAEWQKKFTAALKDEPEFGIIQDEIEQAQTERRLRMRESRVVFECKAILANIWTSVTAKNVRNWRNDYLDYAEVELQKAERDGRISVGGKAALEREIALRRNWCVGVVVNRTGRTLSLVGREIPYDTGKNEVAFIFTNAVPEGAAITAPGYEPLKVDAARLDGKALVVSVNSMMERVGEATVDLPHLPEGMVCIIDGTLYTGGKVQVSEGLHDLVFRKLSSAADGTQDFNDITVKANLRRNETMRPEIPVHWTENPNVGKSREKAALLAKGDEIYATCQKGLELMPIGDRRSRLNKVHALLSHYQTPEALGERRMTELRKRYREEEAKAVGYVVNAMGSPIRVKVYANWVDMATGEKAVIVYERGHAEGMPPDAYAEIPGYEYAFLPNQDAFDGGTFVIAPDMVRPRPVEVALPPLEADERCHVDGKTVQGSLELQPGDYICVYSKDGCSDQRFQVRIAVGTPCTLPAPGKWEKTGVFGQLFDTVRGMSDATARGVKSTVDNVTTIERKGN